MGASDGAVLAFRQLLNNGANNLRYNIVLVAEGYTALEIPRFQIECRRFMRKLFWTAPFDSLRCTFNVFALEVSSTASGMDDPATCGDGSAGSGAMPATFFDATMCGGGSVRRVVTVDSGAVRNKVAGFLPQANSILVLVNSSLDGGAGGDLAVFTTKAGWEETAIHEFGHLLGLADEYGCYVCDGTDSGRTYTALDSIFKGYGLPGEPNVSDTSTRGTLKWASSVAAATPLPTTPGSVPAGTVGAFASAKYYDLGLFRPEASCRMRTLNTPFCAVCRAAIMTRLTSWTPTGACVTPIATAPTLTVVARIGRKVLIGPARGGYDVSLITTTDLPGTPALTWQLDGEPATPLPAPPVIRVPINLNASTYLYNHTADVQGRTGLDELDYWVPATFNTASGSVAIALLEPNDALNVLGADYGNAGNTEGTGVVSINVGGIRARNGWLYIATRRFYTRIAVRLKLHDGFFGPDDSPNWAPQSITWTPAPSQTSGLTSFYDVTFEPSGLCSLDSNPSTVVDPNVGFQITARGKDAIGQPFTAAGTLRPTNVEYTRSISTIELSRIPKWEWPVQFDIREKVLEVVFAGVLVVLEGEVLKIGDMKVEVKKARPG